jgi:hypothetical protein
MPERPTRRSRGFLPFSAVVLCLALGGCTSVPQSPPVAIRFTAVEMAADLVVSSVEARVGTSSVTFIIRYTSAIDRRCSFFSPPDGGVFMEYRDLPAAGKTASISLSKAVLRRATAISMKFWPLGGGQSGALFLNFADIEPLLGEGTVLPQGAPPSAGQESGTIEAETPAGPAYAIGFARTELVSDLSVSSVTARAGKETVTFSIEYSSGKNRSLSLFNPPEGAVIKELRPVSAGNHVIEIPVRKSILDEIQGLAGKFFNGAEDCGSIVLILDDVKPLLGENPARIDVSEVPVGPPVTVRYKAVELAPDLAIVRVTAQPSATRITITIRYESGVDRILAMFDPPGGDAFELRRAMPAAEDEATVTLTKEALRKTQSITVTFYTGSRGSGSLFLTYDDIQPLLKEPPVAD